MFNLRIVKVGSKCLTMRRKFFHPHWGWEIVQGRDEITGERSHEGSVDYR